MKHHYARGNAVAPDSQPAAPPIPEPAQSALGSFVGPGAHSNMPHLGVGAASMHPPHIPIADTLRNVAAQIHGASVKLPMMKQGLAGMQAKPAGLAKGGIPPAVAAKIIQVVKEALAHLANKDASSAAAALSASPEAMMHPRIAHAAGQLRSANGLAPATRILSAMAAQAPPPGASQPSVAPAMS